MRSFNFTQVTFSGVLKADILGPPTCYTLQTPCQILSPIKSYTARPYDAAADGTVTTIKDDSNIGGFDPKYWYEGNYIVIKHNSEFTGYEHFRYKGIVVETGDFVKQGQLIGYSGNTGYSRGPHLHFEVMKFWGAGNEDYVTLKARFKDFYDEY